MPVTADPRSTPAEPTNSSNPAHHDHASGGTPHGLVPSLADTAAYIAGTGSALPRRVLTNAELERMVDTSHAWIVERTGIHERRIVEPGQTASTLGTEAAAKALAAANVEAHELDLIIVATVTGDMPVPATACLLQTKLGAVNAAAFDLNAGCTGFLYALTTAEQFIRCGTYRKILVVGVEVLSTLADWTDRSTCVLFGDGAGAAVIQADPVGRQVGHGLLATRLGADGTGAEHLYIPAGGSKQPASSSTVAERGHFLKMNGSAIFKSAVRRMAQTVRALADAALVALGQIDLVIPHQANRRIIEATCSLLGLGMDRAFVNIERYGNTSSASTIIALDEAIRGGRVGAGSLVALVAFGAGLTWGGALFRL